MGNARYVIEDGGVLVVKLGMKSIGSKEFEDREDIRKIVLPRTVQRIESCAFSGCKNLKAITFYPGLETIGHLAFSGCESLIRIDLPEGFTKIGEDAFSNCTELRTVNLPSSLSWISEMAFYGCTSLKQIVIPSVTGVHRDAFYKCNNLEKVIIRDVKPRVRRTEKDMAVLLEEPLRDPSGSLYAVIFRVEPDEDADAYARCAIIDLISDSFRNSAAFLDWEEDNFKPSNVLSDYVREAGSEVRYAVVEVPEEVDIKTVQSSGYRCAIDRTLHNTALSLEWKPLFPHLAHESL